MGTDDAIAFLAELLDCDPSAVVPLALRILAAHLSDWRCRFILRRVPIGSLRHQPRMSTRIDRIARAYGAASDGLGLEPPPIIAALGHVTDGNHRIAAAKRHGLAEIDVFEVRHERPERDPRREASQ